MRPRRRRADAAALGALLVGLSGCASGRGAAPDPTPLPTPGPDPETDDLALLGGCGRAPRHVVPKYVLPYPVGEAYELTQGNCGRTSHDGRFAFAFDFRMPVGTPVIASRDGVVLAVRSGGPNGTRRVGDENYIFIEHADGEISRYIHLTTEGALVEPGQRVARGDTIGLSGNSGQSSFPHLHFDVAEGCGSHRCITIWAAFLNSSPPIPIERAAVQARASDHR